MLNGAVSIERVVSGIKHWFDDPDFLENIYKLENVIDTEILEDVIYEIETSYVEEEKEEKEIIEIYRNLYGVVINRLQEGFKNDIHNEEKVNPGTYNDYLCRTVYKLIYFIETTGCSHLFPEYVTACKNMLLLNTPLDVLINTRDTLKDDLFYNGYVALIDNKNIYKIMNDIVKEKYLLLGSKEFENVFNTKYSYLNSIMLKYQNYCKIYGKCKNLCSFQEYQEEEKQEKLRNVLKR